jgi:hypothetical protein
LPGEADHAEAGAEEIAQHAREEPVRGEESEERWMLPVCDSGHDDSVEIAHDLPERLGVFGRVPGERPPDVAGPGVRHHRVFGDVTTVVGDPVDDGVALLAELFRCHGKTSRKRVIPHL